MNGPMQHTIIPIQIRPDLTVFIQGIPHDLSEVEALKIINLVQALSAGERNKE